MAISDLTRTSLLLAALALAITGCGSGSSSSGSAQGGANAASAEAQSAAQGDIPDNQKFLRFQNSQAGYSNQYPEGWAQKGSTTDVTFSDKDNSVEIAVSKGPTPTVSSVSAELRKEAARDTTLKPGTPQQITEGPNQTVHVVYHVEGPPDPVTGKRFTLMVDRYVLGNKGRIATVNEATPVGVDNVDAYRMIIQSYRWS